MTDPVWTPAQLRSLASLADALAFDLADVCHPSATYSFRDGLRALADHDEPKAQTAN